MDSRTLFHNIMHYENFDRMPVYHWAGWTETNERWYGEGLPRDVIQNVWFNAEFLPCLQSLPFDWCLRPPFERAVIEEGDTWRIVRAEDGVTAKEFKNQSCIPQYIDFLFKDRSGWDEYKKRLQPDPARIPDDIDETVRKFEASGAPICITMGSFVGFTRNWMGVENLAMASLEDPDLVAEVADTIAELLCWGFDRILPRVKHVDVAWGWEDICFRSGPLISPDVFRDCVKPAYAKVTAKLRSYGCDLCLVDCDGLIEHLVPHWLDAGVNVMFPFEIGAWNQDPMALRRKYGKQVRILGGIDKLVLERDRVAIDAEIERRKPLMAEGGFIPMPDHLMTPATPLDNYRYYLDRIRELRF